jgi:ABC-2 type transport system ATP-binding protein
MSSDQYSVQAVNLHRWFGSIQAVNGISFGIRPGEIVGFLGPNGAGKSTTMRILTGLLRASSGQAWVHGRSVATEPEETKRLIGFMPENNPLPEDLRVEEYLHLRAKLKGLSRPRRKQEVARVVGLCDLQHTAARKLIGNLSKGFRQRVGIADALLGQPPVIILDEPTIGLDPFQVIAFRKLLQSLRGRMTLIISSHILPEIEKVCDRAIIINQGQVVAEGSPGELRQTFTPGTVYEITLEGELPSLEELSTRLRCDIREEDQYPVPGTNLRHYTLGTSAAEDVAPALIEGLSGQTGLRLHEITRRRPGLEEIFLAATRRNWDTTSPPLPPAETLP